MLTDKDMAASIGISPESFSKRKSGQVPWTDEEKIKLTELYGRSAPEGAWDGQITIDELTGRLNDRNRTIDEKDRVIEEQASEIMQHVADRKNGIYFYITLIAICLVAAAWPFAPVLQERWVNEVYHDEIKDMIIETQKQRIETLSLALGAAIAVDEKWGKIFDVQDKKIEEIGEKLKATGVK